MSTARGTFEVKISPSTLCDPSDDRSIVRMSLDKTFSGDLEGTSKGEMLSAGTEIKGSAGYVALERVSGSLNGRAGSFVLQHSGTLRRGVPELKISVVPDSGTAELIGLAGQMTIDVAEGQHSYELEYTLRVIEFG